MIDTESAVARAYDALAPDYEKQLAQNLVAAYMRARLHSHFARVFHPGNAVLDFTAGTGVDALFLAERGIHVTAIDISPAMIAELEKKALQGGWTVDARLLPAERLSELQGRFDGAISTFAGLNTIADVHRLAQDLARCLRPHGRVILHALNSFCLWEHAAAVLTGRGGRRISPMMQVGSEAVVHHLYNPVALWRDAFAPYFTLRRVHGLSIIAAPALLKRAPSLAPAILTVDRLLGPVLPAAGDFFVLDLECD